MNNPATLGLMEQGSRLDLAVGMLGPDVTAKMAGMPDANSSGTSYFMPAVGWTKKDGAMTYGVALFAQGGMGTEYGGNSFMAAGSGQSTRSELGVGRLIAPLSYNVNPDLTIGGSLDFVWAMMDLKMAASPAQLGSMVTGGSGALGGALAGGALSTADWARVDFSDNNKYTGQAKATGFAGKIGFVYKISPMVSLGGTYHSKTSLSDMETSSGGASMSANPGHAATATFSDSGKITIHNFQWPETYGLGISVQATPSLMIAADYKRIGWADVMKNFNMTYTSSGMGGSVDFTLPQNWKDQDVFELGGSYKATDALILRAGVNLANNPIPDSFMNALFPAIETNHYTVGFGYAVSKASDVNFSLQYAPNVSQTNPGQAGVSPAVTVDHSQTSWQLMYSKRF
jgi:long-chain fatty acid transport protein